MSCLMCDAVKPRHSRTWRVLCRPCLEEMRRGVEMPLSFLTYAHMLDLLYVEYWNTVA